MVGTAAKKTAQRTWAIIALAVGVLVFFFGISLYTHLAGLPPMPQPLHYGLTRPWELSPRIPRKASYWRCRVSISTHIILYCRSGLMPVSRLRFAKFIITSICCRPVLAAGMYDEWAVKTAATRE